MALHARKPKRSAPPSASRMPAHHFLASKRQICKDAAPLGMAVARELALKAGRTVINDLGARLHGALPPVLSDLAANSWDADACRVEMRLPKGRIGPRSTIVVKDNGTGMSQDDIVDKYLRIGRERREEEGTDTTDGRRRVMGRKGIGKLSVFGVARTMTIETTKDGRRTAFRMKIGDILECAGKKLAYRPQVLADNVKTKNADGTVVTLTNLKRSAPIDADSVRRGIARHFSVIGSGFKVEINGKALGPSDKAGHINVEREWIIDGERISPRGGAEEWIVSGRIVASAKPLDEEDVGLAITARGKLVQAPTTFGARSGGKHTYSYITGEVAAEFIDEEEDLVGTNRLSIIWDTPKGEAIREWGAKKLKEVSAELADSRRKRRERSVREDKEVGPWLKGLEPPERRTADRIIRMLVSNSRLDDTRRIEIMGYMRDSFEQRAFRDMVEGLPEEPASAEILDVFKTWDLIEAREMLRIVRGRLDAIERLADMVDSGAKEVPDMHKYFKKWPWILDPTWTQWRDEVRYSEILAREYPDKQLGEADRRIDFMAIGVGDTMHVVELKRPGYSIGSDDMTQLKRYVAFVEDHIGNDPDRPYKSVAGYIVASSVRKDRDTVYDVRNAVRGRMYVRTYEDLMARARHLHEECRKKLDEFERAERGSA